MDPLQSRESLKREARLSESEKRYYDGCQGQTVTERSEDVILLALKLEEGAMSQGRQTASKSWTRQLFPWSPEKECSPANPFNTSDLSNGKVINLCCFKLLNLCQFVIAAMGN